MENNHTFSQHHTLLCDNNRNDYSEQENSLKICTQCKKKFENKCSKNQIWNTQSSDVVSTEVKARRECWKRFLKAELRDVQSCGFWRACAVEFLGVFLLCFYHIGIIILVPGKEPPPLLHISIGHGIYVAAVLTALGATGGCHMNPAVTMAFCSLRQVGLARTMAYAVFQCVGAIAGTLVLREISLDSEAGNLGLIAPGENISNRQAIFTEMIVTGFLMMVVVATSDKNRSDIQSSGPLIVGLTITVNTILTNQLSGSCMNPARATGPAVVMGDYNHLWMYWLSPCVGALIGAHVYTQCLAPSLSNDSLLACCRGRDSRKEDRVNREAVKAFLELGASSETDL